MHFIIKFFYQNINNKIAFVVDKRKCQQSTKIIFLDMAMQIFQHAIDIKYLKMLCLSHTSKKQLR